MNKNLKAVLLSILPGLLIASGTIFKSSVDSSYQCIGHLAYPVPLHQHGFPVPYFWDGCAATNQTALNGVDPREGFNILLFVVDILVWTCAAAIVTAVYRRLKRDDSSRSEHE